MADGPERGRAGDCNAVTEPRQDAHTTPGCVGGHRRAGNVRTAAWSGLPNLAWHDVPLQADLHQALKLPVVVTNDVRAITLGEWEAPGAVATT
ncbi:MAG: ROK family protein [bacterium]|nr:ROK family protein [bacterium]